jgi:hypothetical protein
MAIDSSKFAKDCVDATVYCGIFSYLHFLVAIAQFRSKISDQSDGDEIGPFRLVQKEWDAYRSDADFEYNYLSSDINIWFMQCPIAALMVYRSQQRLFNLLNRNPSAVELYQDLWPQTDTAKLTSDLADALTATKDLLAPAAQAYFGQDVPVVVSSDPDAPPKGGSPGNINFNKVPNGALGNKLAHQILDDFNTAGFGSNQQIAALANAIGESHLVPDAHAGRGEDSWGLFQLNRRAGLGVGHTPDELVNPETNIQIIIQAAQKVKSFVRAASMEDAVTAFVQFVERPSDIKGQVTARIAIARGFLT